MTLGKVSSSAEDSTQRGTQLRSIRCNTPSSLGRGRGPWVALNSIHSRDHSWPALQVTLGLAFCLEICSLGTSSLIQKKFFWTTGIYQAVSFIKKYLGLPQELQLKGSRRMLIKRASIWARSTCQAQFQVLSCSISPCINSVIVGPCINSGKTLSPFYKCRKGSSERLSDLPKVTQLLSSRAFFDSQVHALKHHLNTAPVWR